VLGLWHIRERLVAKPAAQINTFKRLFWTPQLGTQCPINADAFLFSAEI